MVDFESLIIEPMMNATMSQLDFHGREPVSFGLNDMRFLFRFEKPTSADRLYVTEDMIENQWADAEEFEKQVFARMEKKYPLQIAAIENFLDSIFPDQPEEEESDGLFICTVKDMPFGASAFLYPHFAESVMNFFGGHSFFVLPSSRFELIVVRTDTIPGTAAEGLRIGDSMVQTVNRTMKAVDRLSDFAYCFDARTRKYAFHSHRQMAEA